MSRFCIATVVSLALCVQGVAAEFGALGGAYIGPLHAQIGNLTANSPTTQTFTAANTGWCARVLATDTRDIKSVAVNFSAATTPGTATIRIETVDANGKPSGSLYDAAATKTFTPAAGWNVVTFDSLPTTGLTAGSQYAVVMLKADAGTTCTLRAYSNSNTIGNYPICALTASDGSTRSNFAEVANVTPICYFVLDDDSLTSMGCVPIAASGTVFALSNADRAVAQKVVLERPIIIRGVRFPGNNGFNRYGTPTVDLRMRILDASNAAVSGTTVTLDKDTLSNTNGRGLYIPLPPTTLAAGTYRIAFDSPGDGSNGFGVYYVVLADSALQSAGFCYSESTNMSTTFTWTDTPTRMLAFGLELDSIPAGGAVDPLRSSIP